MSLLSVFNLIQAIPRAHPNSSTPIDKDRAYEIAGQTFCYCQSFEVAVLNSLRPSGVPTQIVPLSSPKKRKDNIARQTVIGCEARYLAIFKNTQTSAICSDPNRSGVVLVDGFYNVAG